MMDYKKRFSPAEMQALTDWFDRHAAELPSELRLDDATHLADLPFTIDGLMKVYELHGDKPAFSGELYLLFRIKQRLVAEGVADD